MKMAKANRADMEAALDLCAAMESLGRGYLPEALTDPDDESDERYDERKHAATVVQHLLEIASRGSLFRVCFGMTVLLDPRNELVDPDADTLEAHPRFEKRALALKTIAEMPIPEQDNALAANMQRVAANAVA
jgi:hypothetical protein